MRLQRAPALVVPLHRTEVRRTPLASPALIPSPGEETFLLDA